MVKQGKQISLAAAVLSVPALKHLVHNNAKPLSDSWFLWHTHYAGELVFKWAGQVGLDVARRERYTVTAFR